MKAKSIVKLTIDIDMTILLLFLMGYQFWGHTAHEWAGVGMLVLLLAHNALNFHWYYYLFKGKYPLVRVLGLVLNVLILAAMLLQMYSGIAMSRQIFTFLPSIGGMALFRRLHLLGAYWGFLLMSLHLGMHWNMVLSKIKKGLKMKDRTKAKAAASVIIGLMIAGYGLYAFLKHDFPTYMLLKSEFVFLDHNESIFLFYLDYAALMGLCIFLSCYCSKFLRNFNKR